MKRTFAVSAMLVAAILFSIVAASAEDVVVSISYTEIHDRILPFAEKTATNTRLEVRLAGDGSVSHNASLQSGSARGGTSANLRLGSNAQAGWRVAGPNQLINVHDFKSYQRAILVTVNGASCTVRIGYDLKSGYHDYRYRRLKTGEDAVARSVTAENPTCSIR